VRHLGHAGAGARRDPEAQSAKPDFVPFQRRVSNPSQWRTAGGHPCAAEDRHLT
jgi:hypothetical protein